MYAMTATRPDITYAIGVLSQDNHDPSNEHMIALKREFRYLNRTKDWRRRFSRALGGEGEGALGCYVDSDYAGCPDDYNSTSGLVITFGGGLTGNWQNRNRRPSPLLMPNTMSLEEAVWNSHRSHISWMSLASRLSLMWSPTHSHGTRASRTDSTTELQLQTLRPSTILLQIWLEIEWSTWATYRRLRCSPTASPSHCQCPPSWSSVQRWEWLELDSGTASGLELGMAWELASVRSEMVTEMVLELQMASGMRSESKLIDWARFFRGDLCCLIGSSSLLLTVLFETDEIAVLEECWANSKNGYHYAKDYDVTCLFCS